MRLPSKTDSLTQLRKLNVKIDAVIDVGVQSHTPELIAAYPNVRHFLFEPVEEYWPIITEMYRDIDRVEFKAAASDHDGLSNLSLVERAGEITHAHVSSEASREIETVRLDTALAPFPELFSLRTLLKIDVDGHEMSVLAGAELLLPTIGIVIIEAPLSTVPARLNAIVNQGFQLWDIVDLSYWHNQLSQVDLVFINNRLLAEIAVTPPHKSDDLTGWTELTGWLLSNTNDRAEGVVL